MADSENVPDKLFGRARLQELLKLLRVKLSISNRILVVPADDRDDFKLPLR